MGYIYILSNPAMPGLLKIGRTDRDTPQRAKELSSSTGVPIDFKIEHTFEVFDSAKSERDIHAFLEKLGFRVNKNREFFEIDLNYAIEIVRKITQSNVLNDDVFEVPNEYAKANSDFISFKLPSPKAYLDPEEIEIIDHRIQYFIDHGITAAIRMRANLYYTHGKSALRFKQYMQEYIQKFANEAIGDNYKIKALSGHLADYMLQLMQHDWQVPADYEFVEDICSQYSAEESYFSAIRSTNLPDELRAMALTHGRPMEVVSSEASESMEIDSSPPLSFFSKVRRALFER